MSEEEIPVSSVEEKVLSEVTDPLSEMLESSEEMLESSVDDSSRLDVDPSNDESSEYEYLQYFACARGKMLPCLFMTLAEF